MVCESLERSRSEFVDEESHLKDVQEAKARSYSGSTFVPSL